MDVVKRDEEKSNEQSRAESPESTGGAAEREWLRLVLRKHSVQVRREFKGNSFRRGKIRFAFADDHIFFDEERNVSTAWNYDSNRFFDAFTVEIFFKSLS